MKSLFVLVLFASLSLLPGCAAGPEQDLAQDPPGPVGLKPSPSYPGLQYLSTNPPALGDGDTAGLQGDSAGNLKVTLAAGSGGGTVTQGTPAAKANAWPIGIDIAPVNSDVLTGLVTSTGTTRVTILVASGSLQPFWYGTVQNLGASVTHAVIFRSMPSGRIARKVTLTAGAGFSFSYTDNVHGVAGEALTVELGDTGGTTTTEVELDGNAFYRAVWP